MGSLREPDDVDFVVDGGDSDPESLQETIAFIKEYKQRPGYAEEVEEARRILESLKISSKDHGMPDPDALLEHWRRCVADLARDEQIGQPNGKDLDHTPLGDPNGHGPQVDSEIVRR